MRKLSLLMMLAACAPATQAAFTAKGKADGFGSSNQPGLIYLAIPDRFFDGDPSNDQRCFDRSDPQKFHGGDWAGLRQKLDYIQALGVDALWITPAYLQAAGPPGRCGYHGYWADFTDPDDGAVEPNLGTLDELIGLADDLHARGMKLILDMVVNHAGDGARIAVEHPDWFHDPNHCTGIIDCPYRPGIHDFAQEKPEVADYLTNLAKGWLDRVPIDGIRMDTARYVPVDYFKNSFLPAVQGKFTVAEVFSEDAHDLAPILSAGFDSAFGFPLRRALLDVFAHGAPLDELANAVTTERQLLGDKTIVHFIDNHDVKRFVNEPGFGVPEDEIRRRLHLALAAIFTLPGIPQLYMGDELAMYGGDDPDNRRDLPDWSWSADERAQTHSAVALPNSQATYSFIQKLASLHLSGNDYRELWRPNGGADVFAFLRGNALVMFNGGDWTSGQMHIPVPLPEGTILDEALAGGSIQIQDGKANLELPAKSVSIFIRRAP